MTHYLSLILWSRINNYLFEIHITSVSRSHTSPNLMLNAMSLNPDLFRRSRIRGGWEGMKPESQTKLHCENRRLWPGEQHLPSLSTISTSTKQMKLYVHSFTGLFCCKNSLKYHMKLFCKLWSPIKYVINMQWHSCLILASMRRGFRASDDDKEEDSSLCL